MLVDGVLTPELLELESPEPTLTVDSPSSVVIACTFT